MAELLQNLPILLVFVVPGLVAIQAHRMLVPSEQKESGTLLAESVMYSLLCYPFLSWAVPYLSDPAYWSEHPVHFGLASFLALFLIPSLLALSSVFVRVRWLSKWIVSPQPAAWDFFFSARRKCWILFHLKNGRKIGGVFGNRSFASAFPREPQLYVEQVWKVDEEGHFVHRVERSAGMIVKFSECDLIELFSGDDENGRQRVPG